MENNEILINMIDSKVFDVSKYVISTKMDKHIQFFSNHNKVVNLSDFSEEVTSFIFNFFDYLLHLDSMQSRRVLEIIRYAKKYLEVIPDECKYEIDKFIKVVQTPKKESLPSSSQYTSLKNHIYIYYDIINSNGNLLKRNIWNLYELNISDERKNKANRIKFLDFRGFNNDKNRDLAKRYIYYLLFDTNVSICFVQTQFMRLRSILNSFLNDYTKLEDKELYQYFTVKSTKDEKATTASNYLILKSFTNFLLEQKLIEESPIKALYEFGRIGSAYNYKSTAPDDYVVSQIFAKLGTFKPDIALWFLIIKCTGCRRSEAAQIKRNCTEVKTDKNGNKVYTIRLYSSKMKKDVVNIIPENLYKLIQQHSLNIPDDCEYLFPSRNDNSKCVCSTTMASYFKKEVEKAGILNADGTPYVFKAHSFRHLMAVKMKQNNIPLQFVQEQLHHESPEMTLAYMEYTSKQLLTDMNNFYDINGDIAPIDVELELTDEEKYVEYINKYINARTLLNGVCARSAKLGPCNHGNSCLDCQSFRTNDSFLPALKQQLHRAEIFLEKATQNNWLPQMKTNEKDVIKLKSLINKLEYKESDIKGDKNDRKYNEAQA